MSSRATTLRFTVPGVPVAQPRQRHTVRAGKAMNYTPTTSPVNAFKAAVQLVASQAYTGPPMECGVRVSLLCVMPRPKYMMFKKKPMPRQAHTTRPDTDNLAKSVLDALSGLVWRDDWQVYSLAIEKWVAAGDEQPHVEIEIASDAAGGCDD